MIENWRRKFKESEPKGEILISNCHLELIYVLNSCFMTY